MRDVKRPLILLVALLIVLTLVGAARGRLLSVSILFSVLQQVATIGPVALGLGLTMIVREFDISVGATLGLGGIIAVLCGDASPLLGFGAALLAGLLIGLVQGVIIEKLRLNSVSVTLGGLLLVGGVAYVITGNQSIGYDRPDVTMSVNARWLGVLSLRSVTTLALFFIAAFFMGQTRLGRDARAVGDARRAAIVAGVPVTKIIVGVFTLSGALAASSGALLSYSLAAASPTGLADVLVPGVSAAIIGGVSLSGGVGGPLGILIGVVILSVLRSGLTAIGVAPYVHGIAAGAVLMIVALVDAEEMPRQIFRLRKSFSRRR